MHDGRDPPLRGRGPGAVRPKIPGPGDPDDIDLDRGDDDDGRDDLGDFAYQVASAWGWTKDDVLGLTFRQLRYYRSEGKVPEPGRRSFGSQAEAAAWTERMARAWDEYDWNSHV